MTQRTVTRADLADAVYSQIGLAKKESADFVDMIFSEISSALVTGGDVKICKFGTFNLRDKNERVGRNPKTGDIVPVTARRVITFHASAHLKKKVAKK